jgi:hypothetical protein
MKVIRTKILPELGEWIKFKNQKYQVITSPKNAGTQGGLYVLTARLHNYAGATDHKFYIEIIK